MNNNLMQNKNIRKNIIISCIGIIIVLLLNTANVHALGISPSKKIIDYDTYEHTITSSIINNEHRDVTIRISANGPLSEYVTIPEPLLDIRSDEPEREFTYTVQLPPDIDPGPKIIHIIASEVSNTLENNSVGGILTLTQQLQVNVPYTGLYADSYLSIYSTTVNDPVDTMVEIINMGDQEIQSIKGVLNVIDAYNNTVYTKKLDDYNGEISPKESFKIEESFNILVSGEYSAHYNINYSNSEYGNKNLNLDKVFDIGEYNIIVLGADVKNFRLGTIAKFNIDLTSVWNKPINDVYGTITITDMNNATVGQTNITKTTINPNANLLTAYLDTANIKSGKYTVAIKLYAGNKIITKEYPSVIGADKIDIGVTGQEIVSGKNYNLALILLLTAFGIVTLLVLFDQNKKLYK
jgi:hypothetical protein